MYIIDIEKIVREEIRKLVSASVAQQTTPNITPKSVSKEASPAVRQKKTRVDVIRGLSVNETHTFRCPKGKALNKFRDSADGVTRYVARRYGAKYRTHRIDGGLQVTRVG